MADFAKAFDNMIKNEGGFTLHTTPGDRGGMTYAGITHKYHPNWEGWRVLERSPDSPELTNMVRGFYKAHYWNKINGDNINDQSVAESIFGSAVNFGVKTASKLVQLIIGAAPDGIIGSVSTKKINEAQIDLFHAQFGIAKIARYVAIVNKDRSQSKFLLGWINRALREMS